MDSTDAFFWRFSGSPEKVPPRDRIPNFDICISFFHSFTQSYIQARCVAPGLSESVVSVYTRRARDLFGPSNHLF